MSQFVALTEIYETSTSSVYTKLDSEGNRQTSTSSTSFSLRKVILNKNSVLLLRQDETIKSVHDENALELGLDKMQDFTRIYLCTPKASSYITVVGPLSLIAEKLSQDVKTV